MSVEVNVLAEFERIGQAYRWASDEEVKILCPFHDDHSPSCFVHLKKRVFKCQTSGCERHGDILTLLAAVLKTTRAVVYADLGTRYTFDTAKIIDMQVVERYHSQIWEAKPLLKELYARGVTDGLIRHRRLGENNGRITIPIPNINGHTVNIRLYLPGAPGTDKMRNTKGHGAVRLYPIEQLQYDEVMLCGGEIKAIVAAAQLNSHGIGAISATCGEANWTTALSAHFAGKKIYVCFDVDDAGRLAAEQRCAHLSRIAAWVGDLVLPLDKDRYPKGDINDFVGLEHGELFPLLADVKEYVLPSRVPLSDDEPLDLELTQAINANVAGKRIRVKSIVSAMDTAPYVVPKDIIVDCDKSQKECALCAVFAARTNEFTLHKESPAILEIVNASKNTQSDALKHGLGIPQGCKICTFVPKTYYNVEDARISPQLEITNRSSDRVMQPAICIGEGTELNESYTFTGRMYPHPATQQSTLLISSYEPCQDALSNYTFRDFSRLSVFQPDNWSIDGLQMRLDDIYSDLEANTTRIFGRRLLHLAVDLAYHSPLFLSFDGRIVKGWAEVLVIGDSAQGKSETTLGLMKHYGLGEKIECKNASVAGLLGGLQQMGSRWFVSWGLIPTHDKRLVILEELKGASTEVIAKLTDMRSSGVAEIPKIEKRRTHARTRLLALSNPRSDRSLSTYNFGVEAVKELIGSLEDIRRFDFILCVSASEIEASLLNLLQRERPVIPHTFTSDLCRALILYGWTRRADQVSFEPGALSLCLEEATRLSEEFTDMVPIIDRGSARFKIARLAAALACRTFSHDESNPELLVVRRCHVEYIARLLRDVYGSSVFGYKDFTNAVKISQNITDPDVVKQQLAQAPFPKDLIRSILHTSTIDVQDVQDWCGWDKDQSQQMMSLFVRKHALRRDGRVYYKSPQFITMLKGMLERGEFTDRPDFIPEKEF